jgi:hypothetical protein
MNNFKTGFKQLNPNSEYRQDLLMRKESNPKLNGPLNISPPQEPQVPASSINPNAFSRLRSIFAKKSTM